MSTPYLNTAGKFRARVEKPIGGYIQEIGNNATPAIVLPLVVIGGPCDNQRIEWKGWLTDGALSSTVKSLHEAFNFDGDFGALVRDPEGFTGFDCDITTEMEDYKGKPQCKVKWLNKFHEGMAIDDATALAATLSGRAKAVIADLKAKKEAPKESAEKDELAW